MSRARLAHLEPIKMNDVWFIGRNAFWEKFGTQDWLIIWIFCLDGFNLFSSMCVKNHALSCSHGCQYFWIEKNITQVNIFWLLYLKKSHIFGKFYRSKYLTASLDNLKYISFNIVKFACSIVSEIQDAVVC